MSELRGDNMTELVIIFLLFVIGISVFFDWLTHLE
nr:MAG TPA: hypothetical protein [Caudoviricetes sp.]